MDNQSKPIIVNGQRIPEEAVAYELNRLVKFYSQYLSAEQIKLQMETLRKRAREQAVGAKLLIDEALRLDLPVPTERVDGKWDDIVKESGGDDAFQATLAKQNLSEAQVRSSLERGLKVDMLVEQVTGEIEEPTEAEIEEHFKKHRKEYRKTEQALAQHILVRPASDSETDRETARSKLLEIREKIAEGASFADMAAAHSECPSGRRSGGSLGWFGRGMMVPEFDEVVFKMAVDELSDIVETQFGFHLIYKAGHEDGGDVTLADVSNKVREFLRHAKRGEALSAYVGELSEKAVIEGL